MKKVTLFATMAALVFASCNKEENLQLEMSNHTITASMETDSPDTRTAFDRNSGALYWISGDDIAVLNTNGSFTEYTLTSGAGTANATFTAKAKIGDNTTYALHPYSLHNYNNSALTFNLPTTYTYTDTEKGNEYGAAPMIAQTDEVDASNFYFEHLGGAFCFTINNLPANTTYFTFVADEQITGDFAVETNADGKYEISLPDESSSTDQTMSAVYSVTINFPAEESATNKKFFIPLPVGTIDGFTISIGTDDGENVTETWNYTSTASNTITRRKLLAMPEITFDATVDGSLTLKVTTSDQLKSAFEKGANIVLANNITADNGVSFSITSGIEATLDLNGHTLSGSSSEEKGFSFITNNGKLTINDSSNGNGKISYNFTGTGDSNFGWGTYTISNRGIMEINGGVIENTRTEPKGHMYDAIDNYTGATLTINGGVIKCENYIAIRLVATDEQTDNKVVINNDAKIIGRFSIWPQNTSNGSKQVKATLDINGGTIDGDLFLDSSDNFTLTADNANFVVKSDDGFASAMELVGEGCTIQMASGTYNAIEFGPRACDLETGETYRYTRTISNLTVKPVENAEVTIAGLTTVAGHIHSAGGTVDVIAPDGTNVNSTGFYSTLHLNNITFEGLKFTDNVLFGYWGGLGSLNGIGFTKCLFDLEGTTSELGACIQFGAGGELQPDNVTITQCQFSNAYQGVLVHQAKDVTVTGSTFNTMGHNAIQTNGSPTASITGTITIAGNTFSNGFDRALRSDAVAGSAKFVITGNTFSNYCDTEGQVMKSSQVTSGATYDINNNKYEGADMEVKNVSDVTELIWSKPTVSN